jgi:Flp pilus assembly protein TadD
MHTIVQAFDMAVQHHREGRLPQAEQFYRQILQVDPRHVGTLHFLGLLAHQVGRSDVAIEYISQALRLRPDYAEAHSNLGMALAEQEKLTAAVASYQQALRLKPDLAEAHNNLANLFRQQGKLAAAVASYQQALRLKPGYAEAHSNLGVALLEQGKVTEAVACHQQALCFRPDIAEAHTNLGMALAEQGKLAEAVACHQQAVRLRPNLAEPHNNLGVALADQGRLTEAATCYEQALRLKPDYPDAHLNLAYSWFLRGDLEAGWPGYEWRWKRRGAAQPSFRQPLWDGSSLQDQTILLFAEQGLGDTLQFIRYAPIVQQHGGTVIVQCQEPLLRLLATSAGIDRLVPEGAAVPPFDVQAPLLSLPRILRTTLATIPAQVPYLSVDPASSAHWQRQLSGVEGLKVGIAWQGNPEHPRDRRRSVPLLAFAPLAGVPGVRLVSLQKGPGREQLPAMADRLGLLDMADHLQDFADTAALISHLDLVITVDTAVAHLAGALGIAVWLALPSTPDWRWLRERENSPWYPSMRLFRQSTWGDWPEVFERLTEALRTQGDGAARSLSRQ